MKKQNIKQKMQKSLILILISIVGLFLISFTSAAIPEKATSAIFPAAEISDLDSSAQKINSEINNNYYISLNRIVRIGDSNNSQTIIGSTGSFNLKESLEGKSLVNLKDEREVILTVIDNGLIYVEGKHDSQNIPLIELTKSAAIKNNQYDLEIDNSKVYLYPETLFIDSFDKASAMQIDTYGFYKLNSSYGESYYLSSSIKDNSANFGKIIISDNNELFIINRIQPINKLGNLYSSGSTTSVTGNAIRDFFSNLFGDNIRESPSNEDVWKNLGNKWISIKDIRY